MSQVSQLDRDFVQKVEAIHFRTVHDTGANLNALLVWNLVREHVGLKRLSLDDLPKYCSTHDAYHPFRPDYGCKQRGDV